MKISVITPNYNSGRFLEESVKSVLSQRDDVDLQYIVMDGGSTDGSLEILSRYENQIDRLVAEPDRGPTDAINKGLALADGDILTWLNADDRYYPGALKRVAETMSAHPHRALCFGHCNIVDEEGKEIRKGITRFKECFFPISSRLTIQSINFVSQPAMFFRRSIFEQIGPLRNDMVAAWDYEFLLRLWKCGGAVRMHKPPLADFRWHPSSISGSMYRTQFREEYEVAVRDAGRYSLPALLHWFVRWGIVYSYSAMSAVRKMKEP